MRPPRAQPRPQRRRRDGGQADEEPGAAAEPTGRILLDGRNQERARDDVSDSLEGVAHEQHREPPVSVPRRWRWGLRAHRRAASDLPRIVHAPAPSTAANAAAVHHAPCQPASTGIVRTSAPDSAMPSPTPPKPQPGRWRRQVIQHPVDGDDEHHRAGESRDCPQQQPANDVGLQRHCRQADHQDGERRPPCDGRSGQPGGRGARQCAGEVPDVVRGRQRPGGLRGQRGLRRSSAAGSGCRRSVRCPSRHPNRRRRGRHVPSARASHKGASARGRKATTELLSG